MNKLLTEDPVALGYLMSETLFAIPSDGMELPEAVAETEAPTTKAEISFLGGNRSAYLFIVEEKNHSWLSDPAMDAFGKSLAALQLSMEEIALVNLSGIGKDYPDLLEDSGRLLGLLMGQFNPSRIVLLGVQPGRFGFSENSFVPHQPVRLQEVSWLYTHSFSEMLLDNDKKRVFWTSIKSFF